ncbi:hypothetical protein CR194_10790 [Salipaludibacillus keqinensis]|uniref:Uncharacterized protein n=1 Tax=Salipaludibacillus keqinensis TaxID=2045207 RepID=A0A323TJ78_9BACI|nr:prepilin-type N-terminal cleavage/methylation domain-containing protein [Salipaludibacillus keqinensis]PYZ93637.1 hypothetical protein CR194_10790 [Salipaludibacillus keqinensis]
MNKNRANYQSGLTLIELLVTITISTMVVGLLVSILLSTFNHNQRSEAHINLRQEGNYLITQLQQAHHQGDYTLCYENETIYIDNRMIESLTPRDIMIKGKGEEHTMFQHNGERISSDELATCDSPLKVTKDEELYVSVTLTDGYDRELDIQTVVDRLGNLVIEDVPTVEDREDQPYFDFIRGNNLFLDGDALSFAGNEMNGEDTFIRVNGPFQSKDFNGGSHINISTIYVDGDFIFNTSVGSVGSENSPGSIYVNGNYVFNPGSSPIYGDIFVDGTAKVNGGATHGNMFVREDAEFQNGIFFEDVMIGGNLSIVNATIHSDVYVEGDVQVGWEPKFYNNANVYYTGEFNPIDNMGSHITNRFIQVPSVPAVPSFTIPEEKLPPLRSDQWFEENDYSINEYDVKQDGMKLFFQNNVRLDSHNRNGLSDFTNVMIVSEGDILINGENWWTMTGILLAPNGRVTLKTTSFEGIIISKDGVFIESGGSNVTFKPLLDFIGGSEDFPLGN